MPDAPDLLAAFADYCERLADEAERLRAAAAADVALCGVPWPANVDDARPVCCQLPAWHGDGHWHWTGGINVTWPLVTADG